ncbi:MAG: AAA family ATPase [Candidatus Altiarchaeota archaeon]
MIITVAGSAGSGKTTLAEGLARELGYRHISAGSIMRQMASERNMRLLEFSEYAERHPEVDREIDERQRREAKGDCVVDGRISAHFIDSDLKIFLTAPLEVRARRVSVRDKTRDPEDAILGREASERKRYKGIYGIDLEDLMIYDIILNTEHWDIPGTLEIVLAAVRGMKDGKK